MSDIPTPTRPAPKKRTYRKNQPLFALIGKMKLWPSRRGILHGIRSMEVIDRYLRAGLDRVILGTAAVTESGFVERAVEKYGEKIAVSADVKDGFVAIKGWTEKSDVDVFSFFEKLEKVGVKTVICTDVSKDGAMQGANHSLYKQLNERFNIDIIASGGVSSIKDVQRLKEEGLYGAIIGKAYYTSAISLKEAIEVAK